MIILRALVRIPLLVARLLKAIVRKSVKLTFFAAAAGALLMVLDTLLLDADNDRPDAT